MSLTFGSLFAGIGGFDLGLERAGMECRWQVENDPHCIKVLEKHWPDTPRYGDVFGVSGSALEAVDVICGGFPCQPVSISGLRKAQSDPRWLWPQFARLVGEIRPRYVVVENVPGLASKGGCEVVADLVSFGYESWWDHLPAGAFGTPHIRERLILVAHSGSAASQLADSTSRSRWVAPIPLQPEGLQPRDWSLDAEGRLAGRLFARWEGVVGNPAPQPWFQGVDDGIPRRVDRERMIGNAIVPQVAEWIGRRLIEMEANDVAT